jgi:hypothetical protein
MTEKAVRQVAEQACKAAKNFDADAFMKVADVPWCHWTAKQTVQVIKKREELHDFLKQSFSDPATAPSPVKAYTITKIVLYKEARKDIGPKKQALLEQVLMLGDWVVSVTAIREGNEEQGPTFKLYVGQRDGAWKIIGLDD